jgi:hypothetical protein
MSVKMTVMDELQDLLLDAYRGERSGESTAAAA